MKSGNERWNQQTYRWWLGYLDDQPRRPKNSVGISRPCLVSIPQLRILSIVFGDSVEKGEYYHGRLSSASTGKLAADRFPFPLLVLSALKVMESLTAGPSTSISSSS